MPTPQVEFQRYECKYQVSESLARDIQRAAMAHVRPDEYAARQADHSYSVASLYLDSADLRLHQETLGGHKNRFKLRVRTYTDDSSAPAFFEIKRRRGNVITKSRAVLARAQVAAFFASQLDYAAFSPRDVTCLTEFAGRIQELAARPITIVRYLRQAYAGVFDDDARVTFDRRIVCAAATTPEVRHGGPGWLPVESDRVLIELKFRGQIPGFMQRLVRDFELTRISYSKYGNSVVSLERAFSLPTRRTA